jgi:hypothetical protein
VLESTQSHLIIMTLSRTGTEYLTTEEWNELNALRMAINYSPHTVSPEKMEKFTELMVRSLEGKGDPVSVQTKPTNY